MTDSTIHEPGLGRGGRMSRPRKREAVLRLLRGEDLELSNPAETGRWIRRYPVFQMGETGHGWPIEDHGG